MKFNRKQIIAISLIVATLLIGAAAVYVGIRLGQQPDVTPGEIEALTGPDGIIYGTNNPSLITIENGTVCINIPSGYYGGFVGKHWCDTDSWLSQGCNCPLTASCDQQHEMADGSIYQQGLYYPNSAQCRCSNGSNTNGPLCSQSGASVDCALNLFQSSPYATKICLDRVPGNRSRTYCGLQQIDTSVNGYFLSGLMSGVPECQAGPTPTPQGFTCGDYGCTNDAQCDSGLPNYECDESVNPENNRCIRLTCPAGQVLDQSTEWPCDCISLTTGTPTPPVTGTPTPPVTGTPTPPVTTTPTPPVTGTPTRTPTTTPTRPITGTPTRVPTGTPLLTSSPTLPPTALISNEIDLVLIGMALIMTGMYIYRSGAYITLGKLYWDNGGSNVSSTASELNSEIGSKFNIFKNLIISLDSTLTRIVLGSKQAILFLLKYISGVFANIKDAIILFLLNTLHKLKKTPTKRFEDEVITSQQAKQDGDNE